MKARRLVPAALAVLAVSGCQNPFDPQADLRLILWEANGGLVAQLTQALASTTEKQNTWLQTVKMTIGNYSSVPVTLTSYTVVYRQVGAQTGAYPQPAGSPIPSLGGASGRRFPFLVHATALTSNFAQFSSTGFWVRIITSELLDYIGNNTSTINGGIDCEVEVFGSDHNGHNVSVSGTLHVEIF
jgi:hypothetical protein